MHWRALFDEWLTRWLRRQPLLWTILLVTYAMAAIFALHFISTGANPPTGEEARIVGLVLEFPLYIMLAHIFGIRDIAEMALGRAWRHYTT